MCVIILFCVSKSLIIKVFVGSLHFALSDDDDNIININHFDYVFVSRSMCSGYVLVSRSSPAKHILCFNMEHLYPLFPYIKLIIIHTHALCSFISRIFRHTYIHTEMIAYVVVFIICCFHLSRDSSAIALFFFELHCCCEIYNVEILLYLFIYYCFSHFIKN